MQPMDPDLRSVSGILGGLWRLLRGEIKLFEQANFVLIDVPLHAEPAAALLPGWLQLAKPARATIFVADYPKNSFTVPYREAALLIHVKTPLGGHGVHCAWIVVDDDTALIYGREVVGYPKKLAQIDLSTADGGYKASIKRRGTTVMELAAVRGQAEVAPLPVLGYPTFNAGGFMQCLAVGLIWVFKINERIHQAAAAEAHLKITPSEYDPIADLISGPPLSARLATLDIHSSRYVLPAGFAGLRWFSKAWILRHR